ncbi:hypothetical protein [Corynebacterium tuberculostearicum]
MNQSTPDTWSFSIKFGHGYYVELNITKTLFAAVLIALLITAISFSGQELATLWRVARESGLVLIPLALSILLAPQQEAQDLNDLGSNEIRELNEILKANRTIIEELESLPLSDLGVEGSSFQKFTIEQLGRFEHKYMQSIILWKRIAPTAYDRARNEQKQKEQILKDLQAEIEKRKGHER